MIKKVKDFWYSPEGTMAMAIAAIMAILTAITVFPYIGVVTVIVMTLGGAIYIIQNSTGG